MVPSRIGVSCATFENVSFFQARTEGAKALNVCVLAHAASACQTDASTTAARSATARFIVRVMTCRSICLLPRAEERGAQNPRDAFRVQFFSTLRRDFSHCFAASLDLVLPRASVPPSLTTARATVSHARSRPASSTLSPSAFRSDQPRSRTRRRPERWFGSSRPTLVQLKVKRVNAHRVPSPARRTGHAGEMADQSDAMKQFNELQVRPDPRGGSRARPRRSTP